MLFIFQFGSKGVFLILAMLPLYAVVRYRTLPRVLLAISPILLLPAFAMLSTLWSISARTTLYYGFQYFITVAIGAVMGAGTNRRQLLYALFGAFAVYTLASLAFGRMVGWGGGGASGVTTAFAGLTGSKNQAADIGAITIMISIVTAMAAWRERQGLLLLASGIVTIMNLWILKIAESAGAIVACLFALVILFGWAVVRPLKAEVRTAIFTAGVAVAAVAAALRGLWLQPLMAMVLQATDKDPTLTGRTYIWSRAQVLIEQRPALGLGFSAFWRQGNLDAEGIWRYADIATRTGFNFHNTFREILVHLGIVGLVLFGIVMIVLFVTLWVRTIRAPTDIGILFCAYLSYVAIRMPIESLAFAPFLHSTVLIMAGLGCAVWRRDNTEAYDAAAFHAGPNARYRAELRRRPLIGHR